MVQLSNLSSLASTADLATGDNVDADEHNTSRTAIESLANNLLTAARDQEKHRSSATEPTDKPNGSVWHDSGNDLLKWRKSSSWVEMVDVSATQTLTNKTLTSPTISAPTYSSGGAAVLTVDITAVTLSSGSGGDLIAYTIPANTLSANGKVLRITCWGTKTGTNNTVTLQTSVGGDSLGNVQLQASADRWKMEFLYIRTGASTEDYHRTFINSTSSAGGFHGASAQTAGSVECDGGTDDEDTTGTIDFKLVAASFDAGDSITQEGLMVEVLN